MNALDACFSWLHRSCKECKNNPRIALDKNNRPLGPKYKYLRSYTPNKKGELHFSSDALTHPKAVCYAKIHTDGKVCLFVFDNLDYFGQAYDHSGKQLGNITWNAAESEKSLKICIDPIIRGDPETILNLEPHTKTVELSLYKE